MPSSSSCSTARRCAAARWIFAWVTGSAILEGRGWMDIGCQLYGEFLPAIGKARKTLGLGAARIASGFEDAGVFVERHRRDESFAPIRSDVEIMPATAQIIQHLAAEARLDPDAVGLGRMRSKESGRMLARQARRLDRFRERHAERSDA